jgi:hypothetical protein
MAALLAKSNKDTQFFVLPTMPLLVPLKKMSFGSGLWVGPQRVSGTDENTTGEISAKLIKELDADLVMDCRFIANPHWIPELRPLTGLDKPVSDNVLASKNVQDFLEKYQSLFETMAVGFTQEGRKYLTLAIGCTGGKHRSVAISEELARRFAQSEPVNGKRISAQAVHRDLGREI